MHHKLLIIGAGASGLMASIVAKASGVDAAILEGNDRIGKKILTTGDGRCNITNISTLTQLDRPPGGDEASSSAGVEEAQVLAGKFHGGQAGFALPVLEQFGIRQTMDFLYGLGLPLIPLKEGQMYPMSLQAGSVVDLFGLVLEERDIPVYLSTRVVDIIVSEASPRFTVVCQTNMENAGNVDYRKSAVNVVDTVGIKNNTNTAVSTDLTNTVDTADTILYTSDYLLLCAGGLAAAHTGSDGSGYRLAEKLGHTVIAPVPAIVQLKVRYPHLKALSGIKLQAKAYISVNGKLIRSERGEVHFAEYGLSGPAILQISREASYHLATGDQVTVTLDLMPDRTEEELVEFLDAHWGVFGHRTVTESWVGLLHKKLTPVLLKEAGIDKQPQLLCQDLPRRAKQVFYRLLKHWEFPVTDTNGFDHAQTTAGGVQTSELVEGTLESRLVPGLYLAGEVMDVDGDYGGYNLQWAWSSGYAAAAAIAKRISEGNME